MTDTQAIALIAAVLLSGERDMGFNHSAATANMDRRREEAISGAINLLRDAEAALKAERARSLGQGRRAGNL